MLNPLEMAQERHTAALEKIDRLASNTSLSIPERADAVQKAATQAIDDIRSLLEEYLDELTVQIRRLGTDLPPSHDNPPQGQTELNHYMRDNLLSRWQHSDEIISQIETAIRSGDKQVVMIYLKYGDAYLRSRQDSETALRRFANLRQEMRQLLYGEQWINERAFLELNDKITDTTQLMANLITSLEAM